MTAPNDVAALVERAKNDPHPQFREWMHGMGGLEDGLVARFQQVTTAGVRPASRWIVGSLGNKSRDESDSRAYTTLHAANRIVELEAALEAAKQQRDEFQTEAFEAATTIAALQAEVERAREDERDRLYAVMCEIWSTQTARAVLRQEGAMRPEDRSASRKENTP